MAGKDLIFGGWPIIYVDAMVKSQWRLGSTPLQNYHPKINLKKITKFSHIILNLYVKYKFPSEFH